MIISIDKLWEGPNHYEYNTSVEIYVATRLSELFGFEYTDQQYGYFPDYDFKFKLIPKLNILKPFTVELKISSGILDVCNLDYRWPVPIHLESLNHSKAVLYLTITPDYNNKHSCYVAKVRYYYRDNIVNYIENCKNTDLEFYKKHLHKSKHGLYFMLDPKTDTKKIDNTWLGDYGATTGIVNGYEKFISYDLNKIIELPKKTLN